MIIKPKKEIEFYLLKTEEGGRLYPINIKSMSYCPHLKMVGDEEYLGVQFINGDREIVRPGEKAKATICLIYYPNVKYDKLLQGAQFKILEGLSIIGKGKVL